jgi:PAS domain S-box-containing protein
MPIASSQFDVALDYIGLGAAEIDLDLNWKKVNTQLADWLGYSTEEFIALPFERVFELAEPEREARDRQLLLDGKLRSYSMDATALCKNGGSLSVRLSVSAARIPDIEGVHSLLLLVEDLTALQAATHALAEAETARLEVAKKLTSAQENERTRIARELHDDIGQSLAILRIQFLRAGQPVSGMPGKRHPDITELCKELQKLAGKVSRISHQLHSSELEYLGLTAAIQSHCREFSDKYKIAVECSYSGVPKDLDSLLALSLLRIVQEALHNAAKHSQCKSMQVRLEREGDKLILNVIDTGVGFDLEEARLAAGLGLISMRERIRLAEGEFAIVSKPGEGTRITARVPIPKGTLP